MTDDLTKPKPGTLDDLWSLLPSAATSSPVDNVNIDDPFRILPEDDNPFHIL
jgi:hypothetical protein